MILGDSTDQGSSSRVKISDAGLGRCEPVSLGRGYGQWRTLFGSLSAHLLVFAISAFPFPLLLTWNHTALFVSNVPLATRVLYQCIGPACFSAVKTHKTSFRTSSCSPMNFFLILNIFFCIKLLYFEWNLFPSAVSLRLWLQLLCDSTWEC